MGLGVFSHAYAMLGHEPAPIAGRRMMKHFEDFVEILEPELVGIRMAHALPGVGLLIGQRATESEHSPVVEKKTTLLREWEILGLTDVFILPGYILPRLSRLSDETLSPLRIPGADSAQLWVATELEVQSLQGLLQFSALQILVRDLVRVVRCESVEEVAAARLSIQATSFDFFSQVISRRWIDILKSFKACLDDPKEPWNHRRQSAITKMTQVLTAFESERRNRMDESDFNLQAGGEVLIVHLASGVLDAGRENPFSRSLDLLMDPEPTAETVKMETFLDQSGARFLTAAAPGPEVGGALFETYLPAFRKLIFLAHQRGFRVWISDREHELERPSVLVMDYILEHGRAAGIPWIGRYYEAALERMRMRWSEVRPGRFERFLVRRGTFYRTIFAAEAASSAVSPPQIEF